MTIIKKALVALLALCAVGCVTRNSLAYDGVWTLIIENDAFTNSDNNYTNGVGISWVSADLGTYDGEKFVSKWGRFWKFLPFVLDEGYTTYASWSVVQEMNTPNDIDNPNPPNDDQPYSGVLYTDSMLYARKERWGHAWQLKLGVVGPSSHAEDVQKWFHDVTGNKEPKGWHTQLPDEPVINLGYTVAHLAAEGQAGGLAEWRIVPIGTAGFGTYFTGAGLGIYGEVGWNLVDSFGGAALRAGLNGASTIGAGPANGWSVAFFGGLGGFGVVHYLPLDGTVFRDSRSVDSEPFIGMASYGFSVRHGRFALNYATTMFTDTFKTERENSQFGTVSLSWYF
ncbi:MAG: lipid A deacylase LpxR family protein [Thermodesulfobacteriota bacterium]